MQTFKKILQTIAILICIGIVLYYFPNFMQKLFAFYIPLFGIITVVVCLVIYLIKVRKSRL
jgi:multisubunit Na+/H+ antiporter MnhC subunit